MARPCVAMRMTPVSYARDHAREGGALLAVATIAAAVGAAVLESRRPDSRVRRIVRF